MNQAVYVAWRSGGDSIGNWGPVGKLERIDAGYRFVYTQGARKLEGFQPFQGMENLEAVYESAELFPLFANRLLAPSRPEYQSYLEWGGFNPDNPPDPIALLSITEGRRTTDYIEVFPCPIPDSEGCFITKFFLHGIRWMAPTALQRISHLQRGETLSLMLDIMNSFDRHAVAVRTSEIQGRILLGYVPRYLAYDICKLCVECNPDFIQVTVERVNQNAPLQFRLLCRLRACWPDHFVPCTSELYQPIPEAALCELERPS
ncbi:MAG: hypothetical protein N2039_10965 [Gemmataceae bacterium]|nr:hypothetical protein [Gemmataceae bacterium]